MAGRNSCQASFACIGKDDMLQRIGKIISEIREWAHTTLALKAMLFGITGAIGGAVGGAIFGTVFGVADAWIRGGVFGAIFGGILVLYTTIIAAIRYWREKKAKSSTR
jgi:hypothetical protein